MTSEAVNLKRVMLEASKLGMRVFRNQVGQYNVEGRIIKSGLCVGSSDLIGWLIPSGKFVAIEVKATGKKATEVQKNFVKQVKKAGGFACIIDDEKKLKKLVDDFYGNV